MTSAAALASVAEEGEEIQIERHPVVVALADREFANWFLHVILAGQLALSRSNKVTLAWLMNAATSTKLRPKDSKVTFRSCKEEPGVGVVVTLQKPGENPIGFFGNHQDFSGLASL